MSERERFFEWANDKGYEMDQEPGDPLDASVGIEFSDTMTWAAEQGWQARARIAEQEKAELVECLRERDGGTHDTDCPAFRAEGRPCNCGHDEARALLAKHEQQ